MNQIEVHPFNTRTPLVTHCRKNDILVEAYAPLARALRMKHPVITELSRKYGCTPAQLMVRWSLQMGYMPLPKSVRAARIEENARVGGLEIEEGDVRRLEGCDEYLVTGMSSPPYSSLATVLGTCMLMDFGCRLGPCRCALMNVLHRQCLMTCCLVHGARKSFFCY